MALHRNRLLKPVRKLRKLINRMDRRPAPGKVHDLRTNTRRFEAMFEALSLDAHGLGKSVLKDLGRLRKRAGKVRDLDVLTGFASTIHLQGEEEMRRAATGVSGGAAQKARRQALRGGNQAWPMPA